MVEKRTEKQLNHKVRNTAIAGGILSLAAISFGLGSTLSPKDVSRNENYSPNPTPAQMLGTPKPSEAAAGPSASPEASSEAFESFSLQPGDKLAVQVGDVIAGDVAMSDSEGSPIFPLYDTDTHKAADVKDNTKTALYVVVQKPGEVYAPYGAFVARGLTADRLQTWIDLQKIEKQRSGFEKVDVVTWTGYNTTIDEAGYMANGSFGSSSSVDMSNGIPSVDQINSMDTSTKLSVILKLFIDNKIDPNSPDAKALLDIFAACLCGCSNPTESPSPKPSSTPQEQCIPMNDHFMKPGETFKTNKRFLVQGDVFIDGVRYFDNSAKTGAIDKVLDGKSHTIKAPYGADVQVFNSCATSAEINDTYNHDLSQLKASGRVLDSNSLNKK